RGAGRRHRGGHRRDALRRAAGVLPQARPPAEARDMTLGLKAPPSRRGGLLALLVCSLSTSPLRAQSVTATATADRTAVRLSESIRVTFAVEGAAPLRVEMPADKDLLTGEAAGVWRIRPDGPATTEPLAGGRERWSQPYRLDPYQPGDQK